MKQNDLDIALCVAISLEEAGVTGKLISLGADVNCKDSYPLKQAGKISSPEIMSLLLKNGADVSTYGREAIYGACDNGNAATLRLLGEAHPNLIDDASNALARAAIKGHPDVLNTLIDLGAEVNRFKEDALLSSIRDGAGVKEIEILLKAGADPTIENNAPLRLAVANRDAVLAKLFLDNGADVHANDESALKSAIRDRSVELTEVLLQAGADVHINNDEAIRHSASSDSLKMMELLVKHGANVSAEKEEPLKNALSSGRYQVVNFLLSHGADVKELKNPAVVEVLRMKEELSALSGVNPHMVDSENSDVTRQPGSKL